MLKADDLTTFIVPNVKKIRSLNLPDPQGPVEACSGTAFYTTHIYTLLQLDRYRSLHVESRVNVFPDPRVPCVMAAIAQVAVGGGHITSQELARSLAVRCQIRDKLFKM